MATCEVGPPRLIAEPGDPGRIERHQLRGQQVVGKDDRVVGQAQRRRRLAGDLQQHLPLQVGEVGGALHQAGVAGAAQLVDEATDCGAPGGARAPSRRDIGVGRPPQLGVGQKGEVGLDDLTPLRGLRGQPTRQDSADRIECASERRSLVFWCAGCLHDRHLALDQPHGRTDRKAGRRRHATERVQRRRWLRRRRVEGRDRCERRFTLALRDAGHERLQRVGGVRAAGEELDLVAKSHPERHHRDRAAGVRAAAGDLERDIRGELGGLPGDERRGPGVQAVRQTHPHAAAQHLARLDHRALALSIDRAQR